MADNNDIPDFLLGDEGGSAKKGAGGKGGSRAAMSGDEPLDEILLGSRNTRNENDIVIDEPLMNEGGGKVGLIMLALVILGFVAGGVYIMSDQNRVDQLKAFFGGNIRQYKEADKQTEEAWQRKVNAGSRNRYGSVTLEYSPKDAKVVITELTWKESFDDFVSRELKGGDDKRTGPAEKLIPNKTTELKENEVVDSLPLLDLPLREKTEGDKEMITFAYAVTLEKEGYYPRNFMFITDDFPGQKPEGTQVLVWEQTGPDIYQIAWAGADLMPKPEMMRPHYVKAIVELNCFKETPEGKKKTPEEQDYEFTVIKRRNKFATDTQWNEVEAALRANAELWPLIETEIKEGKCE